MNGVTEALKKAIAWLLRLRVVRAALMFSDNGGGLLAAAITFRALFAVFAAVLLGFSIASIWLSSRSELWESLVATIDQVIPGLLGTGGSGVIDVSKMETLGLGFASIASVVALVWAGVSAVGNLREAVRTIAGTQHAAGSALMTRIYDLLFAASLAVLLGAAAVVTFVGSAFTDTLLGWVGLSGSGAGVVLTRVLTLIVTFLLNAVMIAWLFWLQSGVKVRVRTLIPGALIGAFGLVVLQQLSSLFVGGADSNPLLATFASLIALLLWFNLSAQVVLIACAYIVVSEEEGRDRIASRYGAETLKQRAVRAAERDLRVAEEALRTAREAERDEREEQTEDTDDTDDEARRREAGEPVAGETR